MYFHKNIIYIWGRFRGGKDNIEAGSGGFDSHGENKMRGGISYKALILHIRHPLYVIEMVHLIQHIWRPQSLCVYLKACC